MHLIEPRELALLLDHTRLHKNHKHSDAALSPQEDYL